MSRGINYFAKATLSIAISGLMTSAFKTLPAHRFLWGYEDTLINLAKPYLYMQGKLSYDNFGILVTVNLMNYHYNIKLNNSTKCYEYNEFLFYFIEKWHI